MPGHITALRLLEREPMKKIDEARLESDLQYRFNYLAEFIGLSAEDLEVIQGTAPLLAPLAPALVDAVYDKLIQYECTWRHFVPRQAGYDGPIPDRLEELTMDHPQIAFRKQHLGRYLQRLVTGPYDAKMVAYLDMVGKIHTPGAGNPSINVPLVQMNALMGFVADAINHALLTAGLPDAAKASALRAFSKLLWVQNDLIARHYAAPVR
jgi:hypothetical protein